jgi:hypothetical protein
MPLQLEQVNTLKLDYSNINGNPSFKYIPVTPTNSVPKYAKTAVVKVDHTAKNLPALPARISVSNLSYSPKLLFTHSRCRHEKRQDFSSIEIQLHDDLGHLRTQESSSGESRQR